MVAYEKGKQWQDFPKKPIKIQFVKCNDEKLTVVGGTYKDTYKSVDGQKTKDIAFDTVKGWFQLTNSQGGAINPNCHVVSYTLV